MDSDHSFQTSSSTCNGSAFTSSNGAGEAGPSSITLGDLSKIQEERNLTEPENYEHWSEAAQRMYSSWVNEIGNRLHQGYNTDVLTDYMLSWNLSWDDVTMVFSAYGINVDAPAFPAGSGFSQPPSAQSSLLPESTSQSYAPQQIQMPQTVPSGHPSTLAVRSGQPDLSQQAPQVQNPPPFVVPSNAPPRAPQSQSPHQSPYPQGTTPSASPGASSSSAFDPAQLHQVITPNPPTLNHVPAQSQPDPPSPSRAGEKRKRKVTSVSGRSLNKKRPSRSSASESSSDNQGMSSVEESDNATTPKATQFPLPTNLAPSKPGRKKDKEPKVVLRHMATTRTDPRILQSVDLLSGSCHAIVHQHQTIRMDLQRIDQMTHRSGALLETIIDQGLGHWKATPRLADDVPVGELTSLLKGALLKARLLLFKLNENHGKAFVAAINTQIKTLLKIDGFSPSHLKAYVAPTAAEVRDFIEQRPGAINFDDVMQYKYAFDLNRNQAFNVAARQSFFYHFQRSLKSQHWLHVKEFDKRLLTPDLVEEVFDTRLKSIRVAWKKRDSAKRPVTEEEKHDKRADSRVGTVVSRRRDATGREDVRAHQSLIRDSSEEIHSGDETGDEGRKKQDGRRIVYRLQPQWRSKSLTVTLWKVDTVADEMTVSRIQKKRSKQKTTFRLRRYPIRVVQVADRDVPTGLPINCYAKSYIRSLPKWAVSRLAPKPPRNFHEDESLAAFTKRLLDSDRALKKMLDALEDATEADMA